MRIAFSASLLALGCVLAAALAACSDDSPIAPGAGGDGGTPDASTSVPDASHDQDAVATDADAPDATPDAGLDASGPWVWNLPKGFAEPVVPADNPMTYEKVELGRRIFYDTRLSKNKTQSCASCHKQELAFTDGLARSVGSTGMMHPRSAQSLANVAYSPTLTWANPLLTELERQAQIPIFGEDPVELGMTSTPELEARLADEPIYSSLFAKAFPDDPTPIRLVNALKALASFERSLVSANSPFDRWLRGDGTAISAAAVNGYQAFLSEDFECFHCHAGFLFTDHASWVGKAFTDKPFHNTGLYNIDGNGGYPVPNTGVNAITGIATDMGRFKAPSLRNIAVTAPYMHDGSIATLEGVLDHYGMGGRAGANNPYKDPLIVPLGGTMEQRANVIAFLQSLTDDEFLKNPAFSDPWKKP